MRLPIVDCRSLIQFCRTFDQHQHQHKNKTKTKNKKQQPTSTSYDPIKTCDTSSSPFAALDILILILVLSSLAYLISPYINIIFNIHNQFLLHILPYITDVISDDVYDVPIAYVIGAVSAFSGVLVTVTVYEFLEARGRKCGRKGCRGLRKGVEFDIQLESEECVKYNEFLGLGNVVVPLEFGQGGCKEELEAELRKMAPVNGRTVLIFREKCGCPKGRLEVWGAKRVRRIKK